METTEETALYQKDDLELNIRRIGQKWFYQSSKDSEARMIGPFSDLGAILALFPDAVRIHYWSRR